MRFGNPAHLLDIEHRTVDSLDTRCSSNQTDSPSGSERHPRIRLPRLVERLKAMANIGRTPTGGCSRLALSREDYQGRTLFSDWCRTAGFAISADEIANLFVIRPGTDAHRPVVLTGSHLDTQPNGGMYDGVYGVLAGLEVLQALEEHAIPTQAPIGVAVWTNEEGCRFRHPALGASVFSGALTLADALALTDRDGVSVKQALKLNPVPVAAPPTVACYVEAHIEQGPVLEAEQVAIGVVTEIQGARRLEVRLVGQQAHAGTTPRAYRKDALRAACAAIQSMDQLSVSLSDDLRFTVGRFDVCPNSPNTIAGEVSFTIDLRSPKESELDVLETQIRRTIKNLSCECSVESEVNRTLSLSSIDFDPEIRNIISKAAARLHLSYRPIVSGAGHDAYPLATRVPSGMIFIPCKGGLSHHPDEDVSDPHLQAGCQVLLESLVELANSALSECSP
ncbi:MAG: M20 family metallo-hydrolase [Gammaproteobacteria bacterium]